MAEADGSIIVNVDLDDAQANAKLNKLKAKIRDLEKELEEKSSNKIAAKSKLDEAWAAADKTQAKIKELKKEIASIDTSTEGGQASGEYAVDPAAFARRQEATEELKKQEVLLKQQNSEAERLAKEYAKTEDEVTSISQKLDAARDKAGGMIKEMLKTKEVGNGTEFMSSAAAEAEKRFNKLQKHIATLAKRVLVFSLITKALRYLKDYISNVLKVTPEAVAAIAKLKGALLTLAQPIIEVVVPALTTLINIITTVIAHIAQLVATLFGTTYAAASKSAEELYNEQKALSGVGGAAKKAGKSLASFDEINQLTDNSGGGGGGSSKIEPDFTLPELSEKMQKIVRFVEDIGLALLGWKFSNAFLSGLAALAGLEIPKNVSIGISLMIAGVAVAAGNIKNILNGEYGPTSIQSAIREMISGALIGAGPVSLGVGAWAIPVAISLVATVTDVVANWGDIKKELKYKWEGVKDLFSGDTDGFWENISKAFFTDMGMDTWANKLWRKIFGEENWANIQKAAEQGLRLDDAFEYCWNEQVVPWLEGAWKDISEWFSGIGDDISGWFSGAWDGVKQVWQDVSGWFDENVIQPIKDFFSPLTEFFSHLFYGLRLIVEAAWVTASTWFEEKVIQPIVKFFSGLFDDVKELFVKLWDDIKEVWGTVSGWFDEKVIQPLIDFFAPIVENIGGFFSGLWDDIKEIWETVAGWFDENVIGPVKKAWEDGLQWISDFAKGIFNGIMEFFEGLINGIIDGLNKLLGFFNTVAAGAGKLLDKDWTDIAKINHVSLPRLAQGAVIPPNREFMAVLGDQKSGTNIETPLATMVQAFRQALAEGGYGGSSEAVLMLDRETLGKVVWKLNKAEGNRIGVNLAGV